MASRIYSTYKQQPEPVQATISLHANRETNKKTKNNLKEVHMSLVKIQKSHTRDWQADETARSMKQIRPNVEIRKEKIEQRTRQHDQE